MSLIFLCSYERSVILWCWMEWFYLLIDVLELEFELPLLLVPLAHHLVEILLDLDHLGVQSADFLIWLLRCVVHVYFAFFYRSNNNYKIVVY